MPLQGLPFTRVKQVSKPHCVFDPAKYERFFICIYPIIIPHNTAHMTSINSIVLILTHFFLARSLLNFIYSTP